MHFLIRNRLCSMTSEDETKVITKVTTRMISDSYLTYMKMSGFIRIFSNFLFQPLKKNIPQHCCCTVRTIRPRWWPFNNINREIIKTTTKVTQFCYRKVIEKFVFKTQRNWRLLAKFEPAFQWEIPRNVDISMGWAVLSANYSEKYHFGNSSKKRWNFNGYRICVCKQNANLHIY